MLVNHTIPSIKPGFYKTTKELNTIDHTVIPSGTIIYINRIFNGIYKYSSKSTISHDTFIDIDILTTNGIKKLDNVRLIISTETATENETNWESHDIVVIDSFERHEINNTYDKYTTIKFALVLFFISGFICMAALFTNYASIKIITLSIHCMIQIVLLMNELSGLKKLVKRILLRHETPIKI